MKPQNQNLVSDNQFNFGRFDQPFAHINPLDASPLAGRRLPTVLKDWRLKEWQAFQFADNDWFINIALFNAKVLALVQVKVYNKHTQKKFVYEKKVSPWAFRAPENLLDSEMSYYSKPATVVFRNRLSEDVINIFAEIAATKSHPAIKIDVQGHYENQDPLVVCIPFGKNHGMYSHKGVVPLTGKLTVGEQSTDFAESKGYLLMDDHRGYYAWEMKWDWITGGKYLEDGRLFGFNLTTNASIDPVSFNENACWLDGKIHALPPVVFTRVPADKQTKRPETWYVRDEQGKVDLEFMVVADGRVDVNAVIIRSKYRGPFGECRGTIMTESGEMISIDGIIAMAEDFYLRC